MPQRYESYNLLEHLGPEQVLTPEFLAEVDRHAPHALMRDAHRPFEDASLINQMLGIDLRFTLADNDLPKVTRMCALARIDVAFPMLDVDVVALAADLPANLKLRGTRLRPFFKDSLSGFLPAQTISKKKQGFGLPVGEWLQKDRALNDLARDSISLVEGDGIFRKAFLSDLFDRLLPQHPAYYGTMIWLLMMFGLWKRTHGQRRSALTATSAAAQLRFAEAQRR
jgi:asparagine synthase (glutamine-hydrolysing)